MRAAIAMVLACWMGLAAAASEPPPKSARNDVQKQDAQPDEAASNRAQQAQGTASNPIFVKSLTSPESEAETRHKHYEHQEKPTLERLMGWGTGALAVFTLLLFIFTAGLWWVTLQLGRDAKKAGERQASETNASLAITKTAADAAVRAVELSEKHIRSYVFVSLDSAAIDANNCFFATLSAKNYGKTPATDVRCVSFGNLWQFPLDVELEPAVHLPGASKTSLGAGDGIKMFPTLHRPLKETEEAAIRAGQAAIYIWGEVVYLDVFNNKQSTQFRMYCTGDDFDRGHFAFHPEGNGHT